MQDTHACLISIGCAAVCHDSEVKVQPCLTSTCARSQAVFNKMNGSELVSEHSDAVLFIVLERAIRLKTRFDS